VSVLDLRKRTAAEVCKPLPAALAVWRWGPEPRCSRCPRAGFVDTEGNVALQACSRITVFVTRDQRAADAG
jgi:hypothetical protein